MEVDLSAASTEPDMEVEPVVPPIICEEEGEENIATNLRAGFKKRQCKHLFEFIMVVPPSTKKPCIEILYLKPVLAIAPAPKPLAATPSINSPSGNGIFLTEGAAHLRLKGPFTGLAQLSNDSIECVAFVPPYPQAPRAPIRE